MASSGSSGDRCPAPPPRAVVDDLLDVRDRAAMLHAMLEVSPTPPSTAEREMMSGMMNSLTSALSALNTRGSSGSGGGRRNRAGAAGPLRRSSSSSSRRRTLSPFLETVTTSKMEDAHAWRKYGQKRIQDSENPRSYYRCTHMADQGCKAKKQVQVSDTNPSEYIVSYFGQHTCRDPSTVPILIEAAAVPPTNLANLISFGSTATSPSFLHRQATAPMMLSRFAGYSSSLPAAHHQERCCSEEAISGGISQDGQLVGSVVGSSSTGRTTVGSAPDYDTLFGGIDTGSFPSSPSSLGGFMPGSFGSFGDDDFFGFDP